MPYGWELVKVTETRVSPQTGTSVMAIQFVPDLLNNFHMATTTDREQFIETAKAWLLLRLGEMPERMRMYAFEGRVINGSATFAQPTHANMLYQFYFTRIWID